MKRFLTILLVLCMIISMVPATSAATTGKSGITVKYKPWGPGDVLKSATDKEPLTDFKTYDSTLGFWRYVKSSNDKDTTKVIRNNKEVFSLYNYGGQNGWVAFAINVPVSGYYDVTLDWWKYPGKVIAQGAMYIAPASVELDTVVSGSTYLVTDQIKYSDAATMTVENINFQTPGEYYVVYKALTDETTKYMFPGVLTLNGGTGSVAMGVKVSLDTAEIAVEGKAQASATVYMSDATIANNPVVAYSSSAPAVAMVDASTGSVTAVGAGTATITATYNDAILGEVKGTAEVTVSAAPNEYEDAFGENTYEVVENVNVNPEVSAVAYADGMAHSGANTGAVKNADGTYAVTTEKEVGDYTFRYWVRGLENNASGNKRIVSLENNFTYAPQKGDKNWLIAVYTKNGTATTEYFNANGQFIPNGTLPVMPGYGKATGWKDHGNGIKEAIYGDVQSYLITVNGEEKSYNYGEAVPCTASAEKNGQHFLGWTKKRDGETEAELVSAEQNYTFYAWEKCTVQAVYADDKPVFTGEKRKILVDTFSLEGETAVMAEFIGFDNAVERGITLGSKDYTMTSKTAKQFTIINDVNASMAEISGYAILADGTKLVYNLK